MNKKVLYIFFALLSSGVNLGVQKVVDRWIPGSEDLIYCMICGTIAGFLIKYFLDKVYVFEDRIQSKSTELKKFSLYTFMAVWTTLIFMLVEFLFDFFLDHPQARYLGGALGLGIGYALKYYLDSRFVFSVAQVQE